MSPRHLNVTELFAEADAAYGTLDVLVNNAAVYTFGPLESVTEEEFRRHFDTNVLGVYFTIKEAFKRFGSKGGSIINIGTAGTRSTRPNSVLYTSTKGAVDIITSTLTKELGPRRIRVNSLNPGGTDTEGVRRTGVMNCSEMYAAANLAAETAPYSLLSTKQDSDGPELTAKNTRDKSEFTLHFETPRNAVSQIKCIIQIPHLAAQNNSVREYVGLMEQEYQMLYPKPK